VRCADRRRVKGDPAMKKFGILAVLLSCLFVLPLAADA
jgi:hypothetical protein